MELQVEGKRLPRKLVTAEEANFFCFESTNVSLLKTEMGVKANLMTVEKTSGLFL